MMPTPELNVHLDHALRLERELAEARAETAKALREARRAHGLSFRQVSRKVRLSPASLYHIENGNQWESKTVQRIARFYTTRQPAESAA